VLDPQRLGDAVARGGGVALHLPPGRPPRPLFPYTTLFRSSHSPTAAAWSASARRRARASSRQAARNGISQDTSARSGSGNSSPRSEEHTSELQSQSNLVCRLLLEQKQLRAGRPVAVVDEDE